MKSENRPLSPHLGIYRPQLTSVLSILHRMTGVAMVAGALIFTYWITAAAYGPEHFERAQSVLGSWFGRVVLLCLTVSLYYHLCNGIRHLAWDAGLGFALPRLQATGWLVVAATLVLTLITWFAAYAARGGA